MILIAFSIIINSLSSLLFLTQGILAVATLLRSLTLFGLALERGRKTSLASSCLTGFTSVLAVQSQRRHHFWVHLWKNEGCAGAASNLCWQICNSWKSFSQETNPLVRMVFCLCRCMLWCLEKVLQFITEYAYARAQEHSRNEALQLL